MMDRLWSGIWLAVGLTGAWLLILFAGLIVFAVYWLYFAPKDDE